MEKKKNKASGLICGQKYGSRVTALSASGISYQIWFSFFLFLFYEVNNLFIYVQNFKFLFIYYLFLLVRMRFPLNTFFWDFKKNCSLECIIWCKLWDILTFKMNILQMEFSFISQHIHTQKILKHLYLTKAHPLNTPIVVHLIDVSDHFCPQEDDIETLSSNSKVPYFNKISGLMYITNCTESDITFLVNLLAMYC